MEALASRLRHERTLRKLQIILIVILLPDYITGAPLWIPPGLATDLSRWTRESLAVLITRDKGESPANLLLAKAWDEHELSFWAALPGLNLQDQETLLRHLPAAQTLVLSPDWPLDSVPYHTYFLRPNGRLLYLAQILNVRACQEAQELKQQLDEHQLLAPSPFALTNRPTLFLNTNGVPDIDLEAYEVDDVTEMLKNNLQRCAPALQIQEPQRKLQVSVRYRPDVSLNIIALFLPALLLFLFFQTWELPLIWFCLVGLWAAIKTFRLGSICRSGLDLGSSLGEESARLMVDHLIEQGPFFPLRIKGHIHDAENWLTLMEGPQQKTTLVQVRGNAIPSLGSPVTVVNGFIGPGTTLGCLHLRA